MCKFYDEASRLGSIGDNLEADEFILDMKWNEAEYANMKGDRVDCGDEDDTHESYCYLMWLGECLNMEL